MKKFITLIMRTIFVFVCFCVFSLLVSVLVFIFVSFLTIIGCQAD